MGLMIRFAGYLSLVVVCLLLSAGCAAMDSAMYGDLMRRAAFDLQCPEEQLTRTSLASSNSVQGVSGCGRRATYVLRGADWILNTEPLPEQ